MRILQINKFFYRRGGAETHFLDLCGLLKSKGHEVIHFSALDERNEPSQYSRYFIKAPNLRGRHGLLESIKIVGQILYSIQATRQLEQLIKETKPQIAHLHNIYHHLSPSILSVLKKHKIPVVMTLHDYKLICPNYRLFTQGAICERCKRHKYYQAFFHRCIFDKFLPSAVVALEMSFHKLWGVYEKSVDVFISPSQFLRDKMIEWGQDGRKIKVIPNFLVSHRHNIASDRRGRGNPVDEWDSFLPAMPLARRWQAGASLAISSHNIASPNGARQSPGYLLYFGRLSEEKGLLTLLKAVQQFPDIQLRLVGDGPLFLLLNNKEIKRGSNVTLVGYKSRAELAQEIIGAYAVVAPSEWYENYPLSVLEAMSYGKLVIASRLGGLPEIVRDNQSGLLFAPGDAKDLAEKIKYLWTHPQEAQKMGQAAQIQVREENEAEKYYWRLMDVYENVV